MLAPTSKEPWRAWTRRADRRHVQLSLARAARARRPPIARDSDDDGPGAARVVAAVPADVLRHRTAIDSARAVAPGVAAAGALHRAQRAAPDGGDRLQHSVPLVYRLEPGRADLVAHHVQQEPRSIVERRYRECLL